VISPAGPPKLTIQPIGLLLNEIPPPHLPLHRRYRTLVFTTDVGFCLHEMRPTPILDGQKPMFFAGDPTKKEKPKPSLVISRNLTKEIGLQTHVPGRFLTGLIPSVLLENYVFWQNEDDSLSGYQRVDTRDHTKQLEMVKVRLFKDPGEDLTGFGISEAMGIVQKFAVLDGTETLVERTKGGLIGTVDTAQPVLTMLNLLYTNPNTEIRELTKVINRIENLSHVLVWTREPVTETKSPCSIDIIELPRLLLTFESKKVTDHKTVQSDGRRVSFSSKTVSRLFSNEHRGLFISNTQSPCLGQLLKGLPHSVVLENEHEELFILLPATAKPTRPEMKGQLFAVDELLNKCDHTWISNLGACCGNLLRCNRDKRAYQELYRRRCCTVVVLSVVVVLCCVVEGVMQHGHTLLYTAASFSFSCGFGC
jgi:hypothetical protein